MYFGRTGASSCFKISFEDDETGEELAQEDEKKANCYLQYIVSLIPRGVLETLFPFSDISASLKSQ